MVAGRRMTVWLCLALFVAGCNSGVTGVSPPPSQPPTSCSYSISPTSQAFGASGGTGSISVTAASGCNWTANSNVNWVTITSGSSGSGAGTVGYSVAANTSASLRTGALTITGQSFAITQAGAGASCAYSISPTNQAFSSSGGTGTITVTAPTGCSWTTSSSAVWITVASGGSGNGNGSAGYSVAANSATSARTGTLTVAGQTFTVTQSAVGCSYSISPTSQTYGASGGTGTISVTASSGCSWSANSSIVWITITSGSSGSGNGTLTYSVAANTGTSLRTGTLTVAGLTFTVTEMEAASTNPGDYHAQWVTQNGHPSLYRNECYRFSVQFRNIGRATWYPSVVHLGTDRPQDRTPGFIREDRCTGQPSGWTHENRVGLQDPFVPPGQIATFVFSYTVPDTYATPLTPEYFRPVADFVTWMEDQGVYWDVTVLDTVPTGIAFRFSIGDGLQKPRTTLEFGGSWAGGSGHLGEDYGYGIGTSVHSAARGTVIYARDAGTDWGLVVIVRHDGSNLPNGSVHSQYGHLSRMDVREGDIVDPGSIVGVVGVAGSGPHLHFEIKSGSCPGPGYAGVGFSSDTRVVSTRCGSATYYRPSWFIENHR